MNVCFNGCSFTVGEGFPEEQRDLYIYDRLLEQHFGFSRTNIARGGSSNYTIFMRSAEAIISKKYNCVITQWSTLNRIWLHPGPDTEFFINSASPDFAYRHIYLGAKEKATFIDTLMMLNGDYNNILELVRYTKILEAIADSNQVKLVFINGLLPWNDDLVKPLGNDLSKSMSAYSKELVEFDTRDDAEIIQFFQRLQDQFATLNQKLWVNLFDSFLANTQDRGPLGHHPGIKSHQWMAEKTQEFFLNNQII